MVDMLEVNGVLVTVPVWVFEMTIVVGDDERKFRRTFSDRERLEETRTRLLTLWAYLASKNGKHTMVTTRHWLLV